MCAMNGPELAAATNARSFTHQPRWWGKKLWRHMEHSAEGHGAGQASNKLAPQAGNRNDVPFRSSFVDAFHFFEGCALFWPVRRSDDYPPWRWGGDALIGSDGCGL